MYQKEEWKTLDAIVMILKGIEMGEKKRQIWCSQISYGQTVFDIPSLVHLFYTMVIPIAFVIIYCVSSHDIELFFTVTLYYISK